MSENTTDDVLRLAQERIAGRREQEASAKAATIGLRTRRETPWRWMFLSAATVLLVALLFSPGAPLQWKMYAVVHGVCAQQHNILMGGMQFPLCARNSGLYMSFMLTLLYMYGIGRSRAGRIPPWPITIVLGLFVLLMGLDGFNSLLLDIGQQHLYTPDNRLRTITGMGMGISIAVLLHLVLNLTLRKNVDDQMPALRSWWELLGIMLINTLALAAIYGNLAIMFWPLAFAAFFGITGVLYMVAVLLTSLFMGYEGSITSIRQLARPATVAIIPTLLVLALFSFLRFWLEGQGMIL